MSANNKGTLCISSKVVEVSEDKDYLELVNRVCYYNAPNLNGVEIPYDDSTLEKARTLINKPVVAKYVVDKDGKPTFRGHEVVKTRKGDYKFGTQAIGTHTDVEIREDDVELPDGSIRKMPCLFAKQMIWKRFENAVSAIKRLFDEDRLHNSWEISTFKYSVDNGIKFLEDYAFIGNCFLGLAQPAYGNSAKVLSIAEENFELDEDDTEMLVAQALTDDMFSENAANSTQSGCGKEENEMVELETMIETSDALEEQVREDVAETCTLEAAEEEIAQNNEEQSKIDVVEKVYSEDEITDMITEALYSVDSYPVYVDVEHKSVLAKKCRKERDCSFTRYNYNIENGKAVLSDETEVNMVVSPMSVNSEIEKRNNAIVEFEKEIEALKSENDALKIAKAELDEIKNNIAKAEKEKQMAELIEYVKNSKCFTDDEMKSSEFCAHVDALDKSWFNNVIAERFVNDRMKESKKHQKEQQHNEISMVIGEDKEVVVSASEVMKAFFKR